MLADNNNIISQFKYWVELDASRNTKLAVARENELN
jgi:hypothetical protein